MWIFILFSVVVIGGIGLSWSYGLTDQNYSVWSIFFMITLSGIGGGAVYSLENEKSHCLDTPPNGNSFNTGYIGHAFIGAIGAFVAAGLALIIFDIDLSIIFDINENNRGDILETYIYLTLISTIGGYSGLSIISNLSNAAIKKLRQEINHDLSQSVQEAKERENALKKKLRAESEERMGVVKEENEHLKAQIGMLHASNLLDTGDFKDAYTTIQKEVIDRGQENARAYLLLAYSANHLGNIAEALELVTKSLKLENSFLGWFNKACYLNKLGNNIETVMEALTRSFEIVQDDGVNLKKFKELLQMDDELDNIRQQEQFKDLQTKVDDKLSS